MNGSQIHNTIGELSEDLIAPVAKLRMKKRHPVLKWAAVAACLCLILSLSLGRNGPWLVKFESTVDDALQENDYSGVADSVHTSVHASAFRAKVLEVHAGSGILVQPLKGETERNTADRFEVSFRNVEQIPQIKVGDIVEIVYDGRIQEIYPCRIPGTITIEVIEP